MFAPPPTLQILTTSLSITVQNCCVKTTSGGVHWPLAKLCFVKLCPTSNISLVYYSRKVFNLKTRLKCRYFQILQISVCSCCLHVYIFIVRIQLDYWDTTSDGSRGWNKCAPFLIVMQVNLPNVFVCPPPPFVAWFTKSKQNTSFCDKPAERFSRESGLFLFALNQTLFQHWLLNIRCLYLLFVTDTNDVWSGIKKPEIKLNKRKTLEKPSGHINNVLINCIENNTCCFVYK